MSLAGAGRAVGGDGSSGGATTPARVLVLNCGSSSVKYQLLEPDGAGVLAVGLVERVGQPQGRLKHRHGDATSVLSQGFPDHAAALAAVLATFAEHGPSLDAGALVAVGHRVVHGGERFSAPVAVDDAVLAAIEELAVLAPLHNPANALGIRAARRALPGAVHVAVFDTAFHAGLPPRASTYAVPAAWRREHGVRRYGFHGTSYAFVAREAARLLGRPDDTLDAVLLHLGNGASACALRAGRSVDTSMGLTPLQGLVMGTRSGDVDPALPAHLGRVAGLDAQAVDAALNHAGGLLALAGVADVREVTARAAAGDPDAELALDVYCYRIRCYVGAYLAALGGAHAVVFTAGVGENSAVVRARSLAGLERLGIVVDPGLNAAAPGSARWISPPGAPIAVLVVPTDEEREIAARSLEVARG
jgi:acetate kinase